MGLSMGSSEGKREGGEEGECVGLGDRIGTPRSWVDAMVAVEIWL